MMIEKLTDHARIDVIDQVETGREWPDTYELMCKINEIIDALNIRGIGSVRIGDKDDSETNR